MTLGEIIKKYRNEHDMSMGDFAKQSNLSKSYVSMLERGTDQRGNTIAPTISTIDKVARAIGKSFDDVFNDLDNGYHVVVNETAEATGNTIKRLLAYINKLSDSEIAIIQSISELSDDVRDSILHQIEYEHEKAIKRKSGENT